MAFMHKLKEYREAAGLTQDELGEKINVSQKTISSWETGRSDPSINEFISLCNIFNCTLASLSCTKEREVGDISIEDIFAKLPLLDVDQLTVIHEKTRYLIEKMEEQKRLMIEREMMKEEQKQMLARLKMYQEKIAQLEKEINSKK